MPTKTDAEKYEIDPIDGLRRELVGVWASEKHLRLKRYVDITWATRKKFGGNSSYIDLYCGPGRARIKATDEVIDGGAVLAAKESIKHVGFGSLHVGDIDPVNLDACQTRLKALHFQNVTAHLGKSDHTAVAVVQALSPTGLHLAYLDPYSIDQLPFSVIETLASRQRMDMIIHVSLMDLQRNLRAKMLNGKLDQFAPGWASSVDASQRDDLVLQAVFRHWRALLGALNYKVSDNIERITGSKNQPLYWLVLAARHELADKFWGQVSHVQPQARLPF
jgi:three-Cys-motif partner protein